MNKRLRWRLALANTTPFAPALRSLRDRTQTAGEFHQLDDHGILADYLAEHGDPREDIVRKRVISSTNPDFEFPTFGPRDAADHRARTAAHGGAAWDHDPTHMGTYTFPDMTHVHVRRFAGRNGTHWSAVWYPGHGLVPYAAHMTAPEFKAWVRRFPKPVVRELLGRIRPTAANAVEGRKLRLARNLVDTSKWTIDPREDADRGALADHMQEEGDPREDLVRAHEPSEPYGQEFLIRSKAAVAAGRHREGENPEFAGGQYRATHLARVALDDGGRIDLRRYSGAKGTHWAVGWSPGAGAISYWKHLPHAEFKRWLKRWPKDHVKKFVAALEENLGLGFRRLRLARERVPGPGAAIRDQNSTNHEKRVEIAKQILNEAGLNPSVVRAALAHSGQQASAAVVQIVRQRVDPARVKFAAAWYGLVSNSPAVTVFHLTASGEDTLHVINSPHPTEHVAAYLQRAGVPKFTTESHGAGTRAYVFDPGSQLQLGDFARGLDASHSKLSGVGYRLGAGPGAGPAAGGTAGSPGSRATYRDAIRDFESAAGRG